MNSLLKFSWSDKKQNEYVNYYVFEPTSPGLAPVVMKSPLAIPSRVAVEQYSKQLLKKGGKPYNGLVIYVRLDLASGRMYLPEINNLMDMTSDQTKTMFDAVKLSANMEFGSIPSAPPIAGEPGKVLRIRSIDDFKASTKFIKAHLSEESLSTNFVNLPVVEANLSLMPETVKSLPEKFKDLKLQGGYIGKEEATVINFLLRDKSTGTEKSRQIHVQKTPFILINTSSEAKIGESDKEMIVVTGYKDFSTRGVNSSMISSVGKYTVKYLLYMGYSFKDVCSGFLGISNVFDFGDLIQKGAYLLNASKDLKKSGYKDPSASKLYYCFKIDSSFPFKFKPDVTGRAYPLSSQNEIMSVVHFDPDKSIIVIKTPLFLSDEVCQKILMAQDTITRCEYDPTEDKVKTDEPPELLTSQSRYTTRVITEDMKNSGIIKDKVPKFEERHRVEGQFTKRNVSDYSQAMDLINSILKKVSVNGVKVEFEDMPVIVGPWEKIMGIAGGYTNMKKVKELKIPVPLQPISGVDWYVMPPYIMIDNSKSSSVADQTHIIVHEYRHHINEKIGVESPQYDVLSKNKNVEDAIRKRLVYLNSPDERESHVEQMQYLFGIGWTKDDVIKYFMGGEPLNSATMRVAKKYLELADEAQKRASSAEEDSVSDEILERMLASMDENIEIPD